MKPAPGIDIEHQPEPALFACLLVHEAANDGEPGMSAVAQVVMNRLHRPQRYGATLREVILQPWQFSCLNMHDPNRATFLLSAVRDPDSYAMAEFIVTEAMGGALPDTVGPANAYCTNGLHGTLPLWGFDDSARIAAGHHPAWYSKQAIESGITHETATIGRQTFGVTA